MTPQKAVFPEVRDLFAAMAGHIIREDNLERSPNFAILLPGSEFLANQGVFKNG